jgi:hypothetical protein
LARNLPWALCVFHASPPGWVKLEWSKTSNTSVPKPSMSRSTRKYMWWTWAASFAYGFSAPPMPSAAWMLPVLSNSQRWTYWYQPHWNFAASCSVAGPKSRAGSVVTSTASVSTAAS